MTDPKVIACMTIAGLLALALVLWFIRCLIEAMIDNQTQDIRDELCDMKASFVKNKTICNDCNKRITRLHKKC